MSVCHFCKKAISFGRKVSHSKRRSNRRFSANLHKTIIESKKFRVCSHCLKKMEYLKNPA